MKVTLDGVPQLLHRYDVDDTPVDGVTDAPPSSNWAYDHGVNYFLHPLAIRKTSDQTVNNSDSPENDNDLLFPIGANEVWIFSVWVLVTSTNVADFRWTFAIPSGTMRHSLGGSASATGAGGNGTAALATATSILVITGHVINGATPGNVQWMWSQNTAEATDTKVLTESHIVATRLV